MKRIDRLRRTMEQTAHDVTYRFLILEQAKQPKTFVTGADYHRVIDECKTALWIETHAAIKYLNALKDGS